MELFEAMKKRRMSRTFSLETLDPKIVSKLIYAARRAPTGANIDYRNLIVVDDPKIIRMLKAISPGFPEIPPLVLVILTNKVVAERDGGCSGLTYSSVFDAGAAAENIALAAVAMGMALCFIKSYPEAGIAELLELPEGFRTEVMIAIGHPASSQQNPVKKKRESEAVYHNKFGNPYDLVIS